MYAPDALLNDQHRYGPKLMIAAIEMDARSQK
jgi:hypothetical protein